LHFSVHDFDTTGYELFGERTIVDALDDIFADE